MRSFINEHKDDIIKPRMVCAHCQETIRDIQDASLASPIREDEETWVGAVIIHTTCLMKYEEEVGKYIGSFNLDDGIRYLIVNGLEDSSYQTIKSFRSKLKELDRALVQMQKKKMPVPKRKRPMVKAVAKKSGSKVQTRRPGTPNVGKKQKPST